MKKTAFTMIELIFVIVIIGILAAIAIPKLSATRTDAQAVAMAQEVQSAIQEVLADATVRGGDLNATSLIERSQVLKQLVEQDKASVGYHNQGDGKWVMIYGDNHKRCISFLEENSTTLLVYAEEANKKAFDGSPMCKETVRLLELGNEHQTYYNVAGNKVKF